MIRGFVDLDATSTGEIKQSQVQVTGLQPGNPKARTVWQQSVTLTSCVVPYSGDYLVNSAVADYRSIGGGQRCSTGEVMVTYELTANVSGGTRLVTVLVDSVDIKLGDDVFWRNGRACSRTTRGK